MTKQEFFKAARNNPKLTNLSDAQIQKEVDRYFVDADRSYKGTQSVGDLKTEQDINWAVENAIENGRFKETAGRA